MFGRVLRLLFALPVALLVTAGLYYLGFSRFLNRDADFPKAAILVAEQPPNLSTQTASWSEPMPCIDCGGPPIDRPRTVFEYDPPCELCNDSWTRPKQPDMKVNAPDDAFSVKSGAAIYRLQEVKPAYPKGCRGDFRSGRAVVEFDVSPEGAVMNARVVSSTDACLDAAALKNISKIRYPPAMDETGRAVWRRGERQTFIFELEP